MQDALYKVCRPLETLCYLSLVCDVYVLPEGIEHSVLGREHSVVSVHFLIGSLS